MITGLKIRLLTGGAPSHEFLLRPMRLPLGNAFLPRSSFLLYREERDGFRMENFGVYWAAVQELNLNDNYPETISFTIYPYDGSLT